MLWKFLKTDALQAEKLSKSLNLSAFLARLLTARGMTEEKQVKSFLDHELILHDPFLLKDMRKAADRIKSGLKNGEKMCIFGDYDADGITATYVVYSFLKSKNADVSYIIPDREDDGYGMNDEAVNAFIEKGISLVITVDTGITAFDEATRCKASGIDLIVTDHHAIRGDIPDAYAVVNPHREDCSYPFKELAGVGVAFKLVCALSEEDGSELLSKYSDVLALGTVADLVSVTDENRCFIKFGIDKLNSYPNYGFSILGERCDIKEGGFTPSNLSFVIAPRINAAGRVDSPVKALKLLLAENFAEADHFAALLCNDNKNRRELESRIFNSAVDVIEANDSIKNCAVLVVAGEGWHQGVIGIVASKIVDKYRKPCILLTVDGDEAKGSARSVKGFNILEAVSACEDLLTKFGGHALAAGIQLSNADIDEFRRRINEFSHLSQDTTFELNIDQSLYSDELNLTTASQLSMLEPFGTDNAVPVFACEKAIIKMITPVGGGNHLRITFADTKGRFTCMYFNMSRKSFAFDEGDTVDVAFTMSISEWMGREKLTNIIKDIRFSGALDVSQGELPDKADFVAAYRFIARNHHRAYNLYATALHINEDNRTIGNINMTYFKLKLILEVFNDLKVIDAVFADDNVTIKVNKVKEKVHLESSEISKKYGLFSEKIPQEVS